MTVPIEAEIAIRRLHALCADAVWRRDGAAFGACHTEDAVWKIAGRELRGRAEIVRALGEFGAANDRILMVFGSPILQVADDRLSARTFVMEHVKLLNGTAATTIGIYYERFVQQADRWLFQWRHFDFAYYGPADFSADLFPFQDYGPPPALPDPAHLAAGLLFRSD